MKTTKDERARLIAKPEHFAEIGELVGAHLEERYLLALLSKGEPVMPSNELIANRPNFMRYSSKCFTTSINKRGAVDLSRVARGQCLVLRDHRWDTEHLCGVVERGWCRRGELWGVLRLGRSRAATEAWEMLEDGLPVAVSSAFTAITYEQLEDLAGYPHWRITERRLDEVSLALQGADQYARVFLHAKSKEELAASPMYQPPKPGASVCAGAWRRWAIPAAKRIAAKAGGDADVLTIELAGEVEAHLVDLAT